MGGRLHIMEGLAMYQGKHYKKESLSERILSIPFFDCISALINYHNQWWDKVEETLSKWFNKVWIWFKNN